jgi:uncharacterized protein DUF5317
MLLLGSILVIGLLLGWGLGGSIRELGKLDVRLWWLLPIGLALQIVPIPQGPEGPGHYLPFVTLLVSFLVVGAVVALNWRLRGFPAILLGVLLNVIPIVVNQGMPVSGQAVVASGGSVSDVPRNLGNKHHLAGPNDEVTFLADVIAIRAPFHAVVSIGDLVMWAGAGWFLTFAMLGAPRRDSRRSRTPRRRVRSAKT